jgi:Thioredoxin
MTTMTPERFASGMTYEAYKAAMSRNRERVEQNESRVALDAEAVRFFRSLAHPLNVVVLAEDWCGDVIANLPVLGRLAAEVGTLDVRIFYRDQNLDLMERWLNQGKYQSIPVVAFFDKDFRELGHWIERPASVTDLRARKRREIFQAHPEFGAPDAPVDQLPEDTRMKLQAELQKMREETTAFANAEVQRELRELVAAQPVR